MEQQQTTAEWQAGTAETSGAGQSPLDAQRAASEQATVVDERPEILVGAAFVGGLVLAQILKRLGE